MILLLGAALIRQLYFNSKFQFKNYTKVCLGSTLMVCLMMLPRFFYLKSEGEKFLWWSPIVLEIIVAHCIIYIQMAIEYFTWNEKKVKWNKEKMFLQQYENNDYSENQLLDKINLMEINPDSVAQGPAEIDNGVSEIKLNPSYYTATFCGLMKKTKVSLKLREDEQVDFFYRSCFLYIVQVIFNIVLFMYSGLSLTTYIRDPIINLALFFTVLLLHLTCLPTARDGISMMKYALIHPDEFKHPMAAFALGWFAISSMILSEFINIANNQSKKTVPDAIAGFIGFKCIIDLPTIYMNSHEEFPVKGAVGKLDIKLSRKD